MAEGGAFGVGKGGVPGYIAGGGKGLVRWSGNLGGHGRGWKGSPWLGTGMEEWGLVGQLKDGGFGCCLGRKGAYLRRHCVSCLLETTGCFVRSRCKGNNN